MAMEYVTKSKVALKYVAGMLSRDETKENGECSPTAPPHAAIVLSRDVTIKDMLYLWWSIHWRL